MLEKRRRMAYLGTEIMKTQHYINLETQYGANNYAPLDVVITKGQGIWVEDMDGFC